MVRIETAERARGRILRINERQREVLWGGLTPSSNRVMNELQRQKNQAGAIVDQGPGDICAKHMLLGPQPVCRMCALLNDIKEGRFP